MTRICFTMLGTDGKITFILRGLTQFFVVGFLVGFILMIYFQRKEERMGNGFEKGKKYEVVDAKKGDCIGCCFHIEGVCNLDITIPCRKGFIFKEVKE